MDFYSRLAKIESGGDPNARAKTSSATGLYQMTRPTFEDLQRTNPALSRYTWEEHAANPKLQQQFAQALTARNDKELKSRGFEANDLNRYLAHFAGPTGGAKLISADPNAKVGDILGKKAAAANKRLSQMTVAEMKDYFAQKLGLGNWMEKKGAPPRENSMPPSLGASNKVPAGAAPATSSMSMIPNALAILNQGQGPTMAAHGGLIALAEGGEAKRKKKKDKKPKAVKNPVPAEIAMPGGLAAMGGAGAGLAPTPAPMPPQAPPPGPMAAPPPAPPPMPGPPPTLSPLQQQQALSQISQQKMMGQMAPPGGQPNAMAAPQSPVLSPQPGAGVHTAAMAPPPMGFAQGGQAPTESMPWEDFKSEKPAATSNTSQVSETMPWEDYKGAAKPSAKAEKASGAPESFGQKAKNFLSDAFGKAATALNTRPEQVSGSYLSGDFKVRPQTEEEKAKGPTMAADRARRWAGIGQGAILDPLMAGAQLLPGQKGEEIAKNQMEGYESFRNQLGDKGFDTSRLAGNILSPFAIKGAQWIDKGLNKTGAGLFKRGAVQGSAAAALQPIVPSGEGENTENPEFGSGILGEKAMQIGGGALLGGSFNKLLGKYLPSASGGGGGQPGSPVERYRQAFPDADLTWGQLAGERGNRWEQRATSLPFIGDVIKEARTKALGSQNVGMMNRALKDAGLSLDKGTRAGREMFDEAYNKLTGAYGKVLDDVNLTDPQALRAKIYGKMDTGTGKSLATQGQLDNSYTPGAISQKYNQLSEAGQKRFDKIMEEGLFKKFGKDPQGNNSIRMTGKQFKMHEEDLKDTIDSLMHGGGEEREIGKMVKTALGEAYDSLKSSNPKVTEQLKKLNKSYAQYKTLESASTASGTSGGVFTPGQTVRAASRGNRGQVAKGKGLLQDEAELSEQVLGKAYPDSGTAGRLQSGNPFTNLVGGALSLPAEILYSPKFASFMTQGGTRAKNAFQRTRAGAGLAKPDVSPGMVRGIMGPESPQEEVPMARGGLAQYADGGEVEEAAPALGAADKYLQRRLLMQQPPAGGPPGAPPAPPPPGPPPAAPPGAPPPGGPMMARGGRVRRFDGGGMVGTMGGMEDPAAMGWQEQNAAPKTTARDLWNRYTDYLDNNIRTAQQDMEKGLNYTKEKGLHIADPEAFKRTINNMDVAGTFIGPASRLWKASNAEEFLKREGKEAAESLWERFGTARDPSGNLKQEIADNLMNLNAKQLKRNGATPARELLDHPQLLEAYPEIGGTRMSLMTGSSTGGQAYRKTDQLTGREIPYIDINRGYYEKRFPTSSKDKINSTAIHELQHIIQRLENTPGGGSPGREGAEVAKKLGIKAPKETAMHRNFLEQMLDTAKKEGITGGQLRRLEEKLADANKLVLNDKAKTAGYNRLYGEAESRLTERRLKLSPEQRAMMYPFKHQKDYDYGFDLPVEELITGGYRGLPEMTRAYPKIDLSKGGM